MVGHGELWSAQLLTAALVRAGADAVFMDARDVLVVAPTSDGTFVDLREEESNTKLDAWFGAHGNHKIVVATGFIAKNTKWVGGVGVAGVAGGGVFGGQGDDWGRRAGSRGWCDRTDM